MKRGGFQPFQEAPATSRLTERKETGRASCRGRQRRDRGDGCPGWTQVSIQPWFSTDGHCPHEWQALRVSCGTCSEPGPSGVPQEEHAWPRDQHWGPRPERPALFLPCRLRLTLTEACCTYRVSLTCPDLDWPPSCLSLQSRWDDMCAILTGKTGSRPCKPTEENTDTLFRLENLSTATEPWAPLRTLLRPGLGPLGVTPVYNPRQ